MYIILWDVFIICFFRYNDKLRRDNTRMLEQGLRLPDAPMTSVSPLLPPAPSTLPDFTSQPSCSLTVSSMPSTSGIVKPRTRKFVPASTQPIQILPASARHEPRLAPRPQASAFPPTQPTAQPRLQSAPYLPVQPHMQLMVNPSASSPSFVQTACSNQPLPQVHYQTARYRRIKAKEQAEGKTRRTYTKTKTDRTCKKCGQIINSNTHKNLWGALYCPATSSETLEEFIQRRYDVMNKNKKK